MNISITVGYDRGGFYFGFEDAVNYKALKIGMVAETNWRKPFEKHEFEYDGHCGIAWSVLGFGISLSWG